MRVERIKNESHMIFMDNVVLTYNAAMECQKEVVNVFSWVLIITRFLVFISITLPNTALLIGLNPSYFDSCEDHPYTALILLEIYYVFTSIYHLYFIYAVPETRDFLSIFQTGRLNLDIACGLWLYLYSIIAFTRDNQNYFKTTNKMMYMHACVVPTILFMSTVIYMIIRNIKNKIKIGEPIKTTDRIIITESECQTDDYSIV
jgi:hypothetical protein